MPGAQLKDSITVLYVHSSAELYGSDIALLNLAARLPKNVRPIVVLAENGPLAPLLRERGIATHVMPLAVPRRYYFHWRRLHRLLGLPFEMLICWRRLRRLIKKENVDLVHVNVGILMIPAWIARRCGLPLVWHWREVLAGGGRWRKTLVGATKRWATRIPCISNAVRAQFGDDPRAVVVWDAIVPDEEQKGDPARLRAEFGLKPDEPCVGIVGRLNDWKGQDVLIRSAPDVLRRFPNARFLIVGDVYKKNVELRGQLERLAVERGVRDRVVFTGFRADGPATIELFDVFVLASKTPEPFGIVMLEAMLKSKPIVATSHGGPLDVVVPGETGLLVPPNDSRALAGAICELLADPHRREAMGRKGRERVFKHFTIERQVKQVLGIYAEALEERRNRVREKRA